MFRIQDGLINQNRFDVSVHASVIQNGKEGLWVAPASSSNGTTVYNFVTTAGNAMTFYPIVSESAKDGSTGTFTSDVVLNGKAAVISGKYRALTDNYRGTVTLECPLYADVDGYLTATPPSSGSKTVVAYCTAVPFSLVNPGTNKAITVIEIRTV